MPGFFEACAKGDVEVLRGLLAHDPGLVRIGNPDAPHEGWTGLHAAAQHGHVDAVRLLLDHGADPNAREAGDNTYPLHWAAAGGQHVETVRALLDAGGDVHGFGDVHELDTIGWATFFHAPGGEPGDSAVARLLVERGARHHIFSAICVGDLDLIRQVVAQDPKALDRRMSRFEGGLTAVQFAINRGRHDLLKLLIELGAEPSQPGPPFSRAAMAELAASIRKGVPMIMVPDVAKALEWYKSIGFTELARYGEDGLVNFGMVSFGKAELMLNMHGKPGPHDASLWFYTDRVDDLYQLLKSRQLAALAGEPGDPAGIDFDQDIADMFYGARQFGIRDLNGYILYFIQEK